VNIDWETVLDPSVAEMWQIFKSSMLDGMNKFIPRRYSAL